MPLLLHYEKFMNDIIDLPDCVWYSSGCGTLVSETKKEKSMRTTIATLGTLSVLSGALVLGTQTAEAGGYYYRARSFYVAPPLYANLPVFGPPPVVVYEPVVTYPAPVAGYYGPVAAPVVAPGPVVTPV